MVERELKEIIKTSHNYLTSLIIYNGMFQTNIIFLIMSVLFIAILPIPNSSKIFWSVIVIFMCLVLSGLLKYSLVKKFLKEDGIKLKELLK